MNKTTSWQQHFLATVALHLLPGLAILSFYLLGAPLVMKWGFPASFSLLLSFLFIGIPLQLGFLYYKGNKKNGSLILTGIVRFRQKIPLWQYPLIIILLLPYAILISSLMSPVSSYLASTIFSWLPDWFLNPSAGKPLGTILVILIVSKFVIDGIVNPIVEEMYFRGYLLPRMSHLGLLAPLFHALLFSVAHLWQPANIPQIFLIVLPLYYIVWWKRNIYISIAVHCTANLLGAVIAFM